MKKLLALILCLAMVFSLTAVLAGCGDEEEDTKDKTSDIDKDTEKADDEDSEEGDEDIEDADLCNTWEGTIDMVPFIDAMVDHMGSTGDLPEDVLQEMRTDDFEVIFTLEINEDGTFEFAPEKESFQRAMGDYIEQVVDVQVEYYFELAEQQGQSREDLFDQVGVSSEKEYKDVLAQLFETGLEYAMDNSGFSDSGEYELDGRTIDLGKSGLVTYRIKGNKMTGTWSVEEEVGTIEMSFSFKVK